MTRQVGDPQAAVERVFAVVVALLGRPLIGAEDSVAATAKSLVAEGLVRP